MTCRDDRLRELNDSAEIAREFRQETARRLNDHIEGVVPLDIGRYHQTLQCLSFWQRHEEWCIKQFDKELYGPLGVL